MSEFRKNLIVAALPALITAIGIVIAAAITS
jgi:hypothetical protein